MLKLTTKLLMTTAITVSLLTPVQAFEGEIDHDWTVIASNKQPTSINLNDIDLHPPVNAQPAKMISSPNAFIHRDETGKKTASPLLKEMQDTLLRMNDLSYNLVKDGQGHLRLNDVEMTRLKKEGWILKGFYGLEGRRNSFGDMSGLVCYHPEKNIITVVYHGTAGNKDGWGTNFDGQRFKAHNIQKEFCQDLFEGALEDIKDAKLNLHYGAFKKLLKTNLRAENLGLSQAIEAHAELKLLISDGKIDAKLARQLDNAFNDKIELMKDVDFLGANIKGEVHKGFLKKYLSTKREVLGLLKEYMNKDTKVIYTGHSQAGGTGEIALNDTVSNHSHQLPSAGSDNKVTGQYSGYFLSAARAGDKIFKKEIHDKVGQDQIARQNVNGDPVPIACGDAEFAKMLKELVPAAGEALEKLAGYDDAGHLLLDPGHETWQRAKSAYGQNKVDLKQFDKVDDAVSYLASYIVNQAPEFLVGNNGKPASFFSSPIQWVKQRWNAATMANLIRKAMKGDEAAKSTLIDVLTKRFAHLHYGFERENVDGTKIGAVFTPEIVGRDLDKMLDNGHKHETARMNKKAAEKKKAEDAKKVK